MKYECNCGQVLETAEGTPMMGVAYYHWKNDCDDEPLVYLEGATGRCGDGDE